MVIIAACSSSAHQLLDLLSDRCSFSPYSVLPSQIVPPRAMLCRGFRAAKMLSQTDAAERSRSAQRPGERPAPPRKIQTRQAGVQVRTPAGEPGLRVGLDDVPHRHEAKQAGLLRTLLAAYTGTHNRHT
jgi:hypothetical protein